MLGIISVTYYFAIEKVNARSQSLKISTARQNFLSLDDTLLSIVWQPGAGRTIEVADSGGRIRIEPQTNNLSLNIEDGRDINASVFNQSIGGIFYELPYSDSPDTGLYLRGDSRSIINQTGSGMTQLFIQHGVQHAEIVLRYRPTLSSFYAGAEGDKALNIVRIYVVNLNSSDEVATYGKLPIKMTSESSIVTQTSFGVPYELETLQITSTLAGSTRRVSIPITGAASGTIVEVEIVECVVTLTRGDR
jgi:hypothetical protein